MAIDEDGELRVPVIEEQVSIETREVETDRVRVRTAVDVTDTPVETTVRVGQLQVDRISVDREVAEAPAPYRDGDTLVISIVEERLVVAKRLFVIEEVRVATTFRDEQVATSVPLRRTRAVVEHLEPGTTIQGDH